MLENLTLNNNRRAYNKPLIVLYYVPGLVYNTEMINNMAEIAVQYNEKLMLNETFFTLLLLDYSLTFLKRGTKVPSFEIRIAISFPERMYSVSYKAISSQFAL